MGLISPHRPGWNITPRFVYVLRMPNSSQRAAELRVGVETRRSNRKALTGGVTSSCLTQSQYSVPFRGE